MSSLLIITDLNSSMQGTNCVIVYSLLIACALCVVVSQHHSNEVMVVISSQFCEILISGFLIQNLLTIR